MNDETADTRIKGEKPEEQPDKSPEATYKPPDSPLAVWGVVLAGCAAAIYFLQPLAMQGQLSTATETLRLDQRPHIRVDFVSGVGSAVQKDIRVPFYLGEFQLIDYVKTPAREVWGDIGADAIPVNQIPKFDFSQLHTPFKTHILIPDQKPVARMPLPEVDKPELLQQMKDGEVIFILYAVVHYTDKSGKSYWTKYCSFTGRYGYAFPAGQACTNYNDMDKE